MARLGGSGRGSVEIKSRWGSEVVRGESEAGRCWEVREPGDNWWSKNVTKRIHPWLDSVRPIPGLTMWDQYLRWHTCVEYLCSAPVHCCHTWSYIPGLLCLHKEQGRREKSCMRGVILTHTLDLFKAKSENITICIHDCNERYDYHRITDRSRKWRKLYHVTLITHTLVTYCCLAITLWQHLIL